jgi:hypothetical protein
MGREDLKRYFDLLEVREENRLFDNPQHIFNIHKIGLELSNTPGEYWQ